MLKSGRTQGICPGHTPDRNAELHRKWPSLSGNFLSGHQLCPTSLDKGAPLEDSGLRDFILFHFSYSRAWKQNALTTTTKMTAALLCQGKASQRKRHQSVAFSQKVFKIFIYLSVPGLGCTTRDLRSS